MEILLLRHGKTAGNLQHRYVGRTDEPLCEVGIRELEEKFHTQLKHEGDEIAHFLRTVKKQKHPAFFVSPMRRCVQTFELLSKALEIQEPKVTIVNDLREMDFGKFEYNNYDELKDNPEYQRYIDSNGLYDFPEGEKLDAFKLRCTASFQKILNQYQAENIQYAIGVVHGGTIMALMEAYAPQKRDFFSWQVKNGEGFLLYQ